MLIKIPQNDLCNYVVIEGKKYLVLTENLSKKYLITTKIYLGGEIILAKNMDYKDSLNTSDPERKIMELMQTQHTQAINMLKTGEKKEEKTVVVYFDEIKTFLQRKNYEDALQLVTAALKQYPNEPFLLSYYGFLEAIVNKNYTHGIECCLKARDIILEKEQIVREYFNPVLCHNLGRAYLAAGNKEEAIETFRKGLKFNKENEDLLYELEKLGTRRKPVVAFLPRSNPINKYAGKLVNKYKIKKAPRQSIPE